MINDVVSDTKCCYRRALRHMLLARCLFVCTLLRYVGSSFATDTAKASSKPANPQRTALIVVDLQNCFMPTGPLAVPGAMEAVDAVNQIRTLHNNTFALVVLTQDYHPAGHISFASAHGMAVGHVLDLAYCDEGKLCNCSFVRDGRYCTDCTGLSKLTRVKQKLWPDHCIGGTYDADFHAGLVVSKSDIVVRKGFRPYVDAYSAFYDNGHTHSTNLFGMFQLYGIRKVVVVGVAYEFCVAWTAHDAMQLGFDTEVWRWAVRGVQNDDSSMLKMDRELARQGIRVINKP